MTNFCVWSRSRLFWHGAEADPLWSEPDLVLPYPDPKSPKKSGGSATLKVTVQHDIGIFWTGTLQYSVQDIIEVPIKIRNAACDPCCGAGGAKIYATISAPGVLYGEQTTFFVYFSTHLKYLVINSVVNPKGIISNPDPAPTFKEFRIQEKNWGVKISLKEKFKMLI